MRIAFGEYLFTEAEKKLMLLLIWISPATVDIIGSDPLSLELFANILLSALHVETTALPIRGFPFSPPVLLEGEIPWA